MPSPLAHVTVGYMIGRLHQPKPSSEMDPRAVEKSLGRVIVPMVISLLPDLDAVLGLISGDFGQFHNHWTHSLIVGLLAAFSIGILASRARWSGFLTWFAIALACYEMHVIMDFFTVGRGVMLFWPFTPQRFSSPVKLFYGLHWSDSWSSTRHLWTLITELGFLAVLYAGVRIWDRIRSSLRAKGTRVSQELEQ